MIRVTSLVRCLTDLLAQLREQDFGEIRLGEAGIFRVSAVRRSVRDHPLAGRSGADRLWQHFLGQAPPPERVTLRFLSPTAFASDDGSTLFPVPRLIFDGLTRAWNQCVQDASDGDRLLVDDGLKQELLTQLRVESYRLDTAAVRFGRFAAKGFVGDVVLSTGGRASPHVQRLAALLAHFGFFAGVGRKTTMGMGQVVCLPARPRVDN